MDQVQIEMALDKNYLVPDEVQTARNSQDRCAILFGCSDALLKAMVE